MLKTITGATPAATPLYSVMLLLGAFTAYIMLNIFMRKGGFSKFVKKRVRRSLCWSAIFATLLSNMANWLFHENLQSLSLYNRFTDGGICFAVWIICFFALSALFLRMYKLDVVKCLDIMVPPLLMATFLARVGCSIGGCCYGIDISVFGYTIPFPVREIEALFALTLSIVLCAAFKGKRLAIYSIAYPTFRFWAEFLRGDIRGSFFGIPFLSPTQIISVLTVITAVTVIIIKAVKKAKARRKAKAAEQAALEQPVSEPAEGEAVGEQPAEAPATPPEKQPEPKYVPRPVDFNDPRIRANPFRIIFNIFLAMGVAVGAFFAYNPFGFQWVSNVNYYAQDALGFIFDEGGETAEVGKSTSLGVLDVSNESPVYDKSDALKLVSGLDNRAFHSYAFLSSQPLSNGNTLYTFIQTVDDIPVYGKTVSLVVDGNYKPLFILKDSADEAYTSDVIYDYENFGETYERYFGEGYTVVQGIYCYYDTGEGLLPANWLTVADEELNVYGVLFEDRTHKIIKITSVRETLPLDARASSIIKAAEKAVNLIGGEDTAEIKKVSKVKVKKLDLQNTSAAIESALCKAYLKSGLSPQDFATAIKTAAEIAATKADLSEQLFCDILAQVTEQTALQKGYTEKKAEKLFDTVYSSFKSCGIKKADDEKPIQLDVKERKTVVKNTIGSANDVDIINVTMQENSVMRFEVSADIGIDIEIYSANGKNVLTTYTSSDHEFALYPEDGTDYVIKIKASDAQTVLWAGEEDYKVKVKAEPRTDEMPSFINTAMYEMSASFASSKGYMFGLLFYGDAAFTGEEFAMLSALPYMENCSASCTSSCTGQYVPPTDMVKQCILEKLLVDYSGLDSLSISPETVMELTCFRYIETENGALVKAKIKVSDGKSVYEGYSFFRLERFEKVDTFDPLVTLADEIGLDHGNAQAVAGLLNEVFGNKYYVTELNTAELLAAFGDSFGYISEENAMPSLYDFWASDSEYSYLKSFDKSAALNAGYSKKTVEEFEKYTVHHNVSYCDRVYENLELACSAIEMHASGISTGYDLYSFIDDPFGFLLGEYTDNIFVNSVYRVGKIAWGVYTGDITDIAEAVTDEAMDDVIENGINTYSEQLKKDAKAFKEQAEKVKKVRDTYTRRLADFDEGYFWELFF